MSGKITYDQANDMIIKEGKQEDREYPLTAELLIRMYFPSLRHHLDQLLKTRDDLARLHSDFDRSYRRDGPAGDYRNKREAFTSVIKRLDKDEEDLKQSICALADQLRSRANVT